MQQVYQRIIRSLCILAFTAATLIGISHNIANADLNFQFGISSADIIRTLQRNGYSQIQVYDKGFKTGSARACKAGIRYNVKVDIKGRVKAATKTGNCRNQVNTKQVRRNLAAKGFTRVVIEEQNGNYVILACKARQRMRIIISRQGEVKQRRKIGKCRDILEPNDIPVLLSKSGYSRFVFTDRQLPKYVVEACKNNAKFELVLNGYGQIRKERRIGRCQPPLNPRNIAKFLREKGYDRVVIINNRPPRYEVEGCYQNDKFYLVMGEFGNITNRDRIGSCRSVLGEEEIVNLLRDEGFKRIDVQRHSNGDYKISACFDGRQKFIELNRFGELIKEVDGRACRSRSVGDVYKRLNDRGLKKVKVYAEACRNGKKFRIELNRYGDRIGREAIGYC